METKIENKKLTVIASKNNFIDDKAIKSLQKISCYKNIKKVVALPDLGIGSTPNGVAILSENNIYPHFIGGDIGCGMSLLEINNSSKKKYKIAKLEKKLIKLKSIDNIEVENSFFESEFAKEYNYNLGTIGKGNHFVEFHKLSEIKNKAIFENLNINKNSLFLLIHSGSRAFGQKVFDETINKYKLEDGILTSSEEAKKYIKNHNLALKYAKENRQQIAKRILKAVGIKDLFTQISDTAHNSITKTELGYLHRKGATPTDKGCVIIAGSRGSLSYLVAPANQTNHSNNSLAHGAGRKWERSFAKAKLENYLSKSDLKRTKLGSRVICNDSKLLYEEAPQVYKNIEVVINDLVESKLITVIATFCPILTYKE